LIAQIEAIAAIIIPASVNTGETSSVTVDKSREPPVTLSSARAINDVEAKANVRKRTLKAECFKNDCKELTENLDNKHFIKQNPQK